MSNFLNVVAVLFLLSIVYLLVKPSSYGPALIKSTTESFATLINYATRG